MTSVTDIEYGKKIIMVGIEDLYLDRCNPRLPNAFSFEDRGEEEIINWLLSDASLVELMLAIGENDFFIGEALLIVKEDDKYIVIEGNRRLSSVKLLNTPGLAKVHSRKVIQIQSEAKYKPSKLPCILFEFRKNILQYLGYRHVTGVKTWGIRAKARYLSTLLGTLDNDVRYSTKTRELAKKIGSRKDYVEKLLASYKIYECIADSNFYGVPGLDEKTFHFNYIVDSLGRENIRAFISVNMSSEDPVDSLDVKKLEELIGWFFRKNENGRSVVLGDSRGLNDLELVLSSIDSINELRSSGSLQSALRYAKQTPDTYTKDLSEALSLLKHANSYIHNVDAHNIGDVDILKEVFKLTKSMRDVIKGKKQDDWD